MSRNNYRAEELAQASFDKETLSLFLHGGKESLETRRRWLELFNKPLFERSKDSFLPREAKAKLEVQRSLEVFRILKKNKDLLGVHSPVHGEGGMIITSLSTTHSGITDHYALFTQTIMMQGTPEQVRTWLPKALNLEMIGTYAQTELGHGSNVRGLETVATYEEASDTLLLDMPTITAMKWWPGALGLMATHAIVYARLLVNGTDHGYHAIMVQIRDENGQPMPGIEVGDVGPKLGHDGLDSGYLNIQKVRVPRFNLLARFQQLEKGGKYTRAPAQLAKVAYMTMMKARVLIAVSSAFHLIRGLTIGLRYNAFRKQGFVNPKAGLAGGERLLLDYPIQQQRMFPQLATTFAITFAGRSLNAMLKKFDASVKAAGKNVNAIDTSMLPEVHATSAGFKAFSTEMAALGVEEIRRCCGGHGYSLASGFGTHVTDFMAAVTYEGDRLPMALQTARVLAGTLVGKVKTTGTFAYLGDEEETAFGSADDLGHLVKVWQTVARNVVVTAGMQLAEANDKGLSNDAAWNSCHVILVASAYAHTIATMLTYFAEGILEAPAKTQPPLARLARLFALTRLSEISVAYTNLSADDGAKIDAAVKVLNEEIRPDALALVEAFDAKDRQMDSLISLEDGEKIYPAVMAWAKESPLNDPAFLERMHKETLSNFLNRDYIAKGNAATAKL